MNYNPSAKRILVFGDSLSWGYISGTNHERYPADVRWPGQLQMLLGNNYEVIEECLNSRGIENGDPRPGKEGRRALDYIEPCLDSHDPLDLVIVLLGSNELKFENNLSAEQVGELIERFLGVVLQRTSQSSNRKPQVLLMAPAIIDESSDYCTKGDKYKGATEKSKQLGTVYAVVAGKLGIEFVDIAPIAKVGIDGCHLNEASHSAVAEAVAQKVKHLL